MPDGSSVAYGFSLSLLVSTGNGSRRAMRLPPALIPPVMTPPIAATTTVILPPVS